MVILTPLVLAVAWWSNSWTPRDLAGSVRFNEEVGEYSRRVAPLKGTIAYPDVPDVIALHLPVASPRAVVPNPRLSAGLSDPVLEEARELTLFSDFKQLSDGRLKAGQAKWDGNLRDYIESAYDFSDELEPVIGLVTPRWRLVAADSRLVSAFAYTEKVLPSLVRQTPVESKGSLLPSPYPVVIAAPGRFHEAYYWDSYFGMKGILSTHRIELARMMVENFLSAVRTYGLVPNGMRDYYLTRSQPPFLSSMVREVYEADPDKAHAREWLERRAYPLMKRDYEHFWLSPSTRYDEATGLNHDWDALNLPRPERSATDDEREGGNLGRTYRDIRAAAESGLDFTRALGRDASRVAGVLLNSMLYKTEKDLDWASHELSLPKAAEHYGKLARARKAAMERYLWDEKTGCYENYDLRTRSRIPVVSGATFAPLFVGEADADHASRVASTLNRLEGNWGVAASILDPIQGWSGQWDGTNGWPPFQVMAIDGLRRYGFENDARRIALKWVTGIANDFATTHVMHEKIDVNTGLPPAIAKDRYPTQIGFLWTNSSFAWALTDVLGYRLAPAIRR